MLLFLARLRLLAKAQCEIRNHCDILNCCVKREKGSMAAKSWMAVFGPAPADFAIALQKSPSREAIPR